jgi:hypothetical protein
MSWLRPSHDPEFAMGVMQGQSARQVASHGKAAILQLLQLQLLEVTGDDWRKDAALQPFAILVISCAHLLCQCRHGITTPAAQWMVLGSIKVYRVAGRVLWQRVVGEDRVPVLGVGLLDVQAALFQTSRGYQYKDVPCKGPSSCCRQVAPQKVLCHSAELTR